ncbi:spermatogenesis associated 6-like protein [Cyprinodon tularosa]|uniref:spermatogenesis associated 6-like protein n=1 Tax=Cyprinodon tularosa TaxID=77115 RepID=UPI0018E26EC5|nr:spermatogenesis associated 6-like protein [Cyprinodon tularosa]
MSQKALKVWTEVKLGAVSCPGVRLSAKNDIFLSMFFMDQLHQSESLPAVFPLLFHQKMTFEKIFRHAADPKDIALLLENETVRIELVQLIPPAGDTLAFYEEDARSFLFPEPKLVPPFSGLGREVLMTRAAHFRGIAPRLEFSTKTAITECPADTEVTVYPTAPLRAVFRRSRSFFRTSRSGPPEVAGGWREDPMVRERPCTSPPSYVPRSQSLSPLRAGNTRWETSPSAASAWPAAGRSASPECSALFTSLSSSPLPRSPSTADFVVNRSSGTRGRLFLRGLQVRKTSELDSSYLEAQEPFGCPGGPVLPTLQPSCREPPRYGSSHRTWEELNEQVRSLLSTPKAVRRLVFGATGAEIDEVLARRSISPGPL